MNRARRFIPVAMQDFPEDFVATLWVLTEIRLNDDRTLLSDPPLNLLVPRAPAHGAAA